MDKQTETVEKTGSVLQVRQVSHDEVKQFLGGNDLGTRSKFWALYALLDKLEKGESVYAKLKGRYNIAAYTNPFFASRGSKFFLHKKLKGTVADYIITREK